MTENDKPIDVLCIGFGALGVIYSWGELIYAVMIVYCNWVLRATPLNALKTPHLTAPLRAVLSQNENVRVTGIARSAYGAMQEYGISIESEKFGTIEGWRPYRLVKDTDEANDRPYSYIVCSFKALPDLIPTASLLAPFLESEHAERVVPTVVLLQNGIGTEHPVQVAFSHIPIISVVAWIGANLLNEGGKIRITHGKLERLVLGLYTGEGRSNTRAFVQDDFSDPAGYLDEDGEQRRARGQERTEKFAELLRNGGGTVEIPEDIQSARWLKSLWNSALSSLCTLSKSTVAGLLDPEILPFTLPVARRTMLEVLYVARAWGYDEKLVPMKAIDDTLKMTIQLYSPVSATTPGVGARPEMFSESASTSRRATQNFKPSMLLDIEAGRPCELEPIVGSILDRARARGVATPRLDLIYASLKVQQHAAVRQSAQSESYREHLTRWKQRKPPVAGAVESRRAWERAMKFGRLPSEGDALAARPDKKLRGKPVNLDLA